LPPFPEQQFLFDAIAQGRFHPLFKFPAFSDPTDTIQFLLWLDQRQPGLLAKSVSGFHLS
jgi:hypothetical protein